MLLLQLQGDGRMNKIYAVGIGPGSLELLTPQASEVLKHCNVIVGYQLYLNQIAPLVYGKKLISGTMMQEIQRCQAALDAVLEGHDVAVISSGDAGVYGMAGLLMELTEEERYCEIEVEVVPGVTAALSCAALVGAPFMNDFALISLSDLMTQKEVIKKRLIAIAAADMPVALYNPASRKRQELLKFAVSVFYEAGGALPGALVRDAYRPEQSIEFFDLANFPYESVQMTTLVLIGNSQTVVRGKQLYCRRGYQEKYGVGK